MAAERVTALTAPRVGGTYWLAMRTRVVEVRLAHLLAGEVSPTPTAVCELRDSDEVISVPVRALHQSREDAEAVAAFTAFAARRP